MRRVVVGSLLAGLLGVVPSAGQTEPPPTAPPESAPEGQEPAPATPTEPPAPAPPAPQRITFELKIPVDKGGGAVAGSAGSLETEGETDAILSGGVEIRYKDLKIAAQRLVLHRDEMTLEAEGDVVFDRGPDRIGAQRVDLDLVTQTGTFWEATAYVDPDYYFSGSVISKVGANDYEVQDGVLTSCTGDPTPDWSFRMTRAKVTMGGYARIKNATMRVKKLPIFYWPYMLWPAKTERTTGLLIPNVGYSKQRGAYLGLAHYQVLGPSWDNTIFVDLWEKDYLGLGDEVRYRPSEGTRGQLTAYALHESNLDQTEWRLLWGHETTDLPWGLRGVLSVEEYSDFDFFREFERAERDNTRRFLYSNAFVSGSWGVHSLNVMIDKRETFLSGSDNTVEQRQLPEIEYRLRKLKLGAAPLYLSVDTTASYLESAREDQYDVGYGRFDVRPELTLPVKVAPWLSLALSAGGRATWWGDSVPETRPDPETGQNGVFCESDPAEPGQVFCGESLTRVFPIASAELVGPTFSRIFDTEGKHFSKYKHVIEPRWSYGYIGDFDDQARVPRFDEIDGFTSNNIGEFALVNRLLAKPADPEQGGAFEILSFELAQALSFDNDKPLQSSKDGTRTRAESGVSARLRFNPSRDFSLQAQAVYSTLFSGLDSTSISGRADFGRVDLNLTWFTRWDSETGETRSDQARLGFGVELWPRRLHLVGQVNYDLENSEIQQQRYFLAYQSQCWGFVVEWREQITSSYETSDYRFSITLKNVGTFLDVTGGRSDAGR